MRANIMRKIMKRKQIACRDENIKNIGIRVPQSLHDDLVALADAEERSLTNYLRSVLRTHVRTMQSKPKE